MVNVLFSIDCVFFTPCNHKKNIDNYLHNENAKKMNEDELINLNAGTFDHNLNQNRNRSKLCTLACRDFIREEKIKHEKIHSTNISDKELI